MQFNRNRHTHKQGVNSKPPSPAGKTACAQSVQGGSYSEGGREYRDPVRPVPYKYAINNAPDALLSYQSIDLPSTPSPFFALKRRHFDVPNVVPLRRKYHSNTIVILFPKRRYRPNPRRSVTDQLQINENTSLMNVNSFWSWGYVVLTAPLPPPPRLPSFAALFCVTSAEAARD